MSQELEHELSKLDLEQIKAVSAKYDIQCEDCQTKEEFIVCISDSQKVTVEEIRSQFETDQNKGPSEEGDNMPGFENAENLLKETKVKFESGDYNATIDKATEAINAGATALNSLLGMGLSYAIKSSEKLVVDLKEMDIDASNIEQVIDNARVTLENQEFQAAGDIVTQLKETIYDLSQRQGEKISLLLDANRTLIEEAKGMGANVSEAEAKLKLASDQANAGAYTQALGTNSQSETLANTAKEARIAEINEMINSGETAIDEAKYVNAPVEEAERLLEDARGALTRQDYQLTVENANKAVESANSAKNEQIQKVLSVQEKMVAASNGVAVQEPKAVQETPEEDTAFELEETPEVEEPKAVIEEPKPEVEEPIAKEEEPSTETAKVCPKCEGEPTYVEQYKRYFCYTCNEYIEPKEKEVKAKEPKPDEGEKVCPKCEGEPTYVEQYDRYFCYTCNEYVEPIEKKAEVKKEEPKAAESEKVCPKCEGEPTYVEQYKRYFCYTCNEYVEPKEKEVKAKEPKTEKGKGVCPKCEGEPTYVEQYDRYFCYTCNEYVEPKEKKSEVKAAEVKKAQPVQKEAKKVCPTCKEEPTYVEQYQKFYCYTCSQYVNPEEKTDKAENACPTCGKEATYVEQYGRNYCYDCKKYL